MLQLPPPPAAALIHCYLRSQVQGFHKEALLGPCGGSDSLPATRHCAAGSFLRILRSNTHTSCAASDESCKLLAAHDRLKCIGD